MSYEMHVSEWLPAYALDILTEAEMAQVAEHLSVCAACRAELRRYQSIAGELPLALAQSAPRPVLKERLMKEVRVRQAQAAEPTRRSRWQTWTAFLRRSFPAWGLALIALLAVGNVLLLRRVNQLNTRNLAAMQVVPLSNTQDSPKAVGTLMLNPSGEYGALVVDGLPPLDDWHQYQIWLKRGMERVSGGVFSVNWAGYASVEIAAPLPLIQYETVGITIEPTGGSPGPTGAKVLDGALQP
jgi:anti-sigma-K factor RskA